jgi:hypothetical protein
MSEEVTKAKVTWPKGLKVTWTQYRHFGIIIGTHDFELSGFLLALKKSEKGDEIEIIIDDDESD